MEKFIKFQLKKIQKSILRSKLFNLKYSTRTHWVRLVEMESAPKRKKADSEIPLDPLGSWDLGIRFFSPCRYRYGFQTGRPGLDLELTPRTVLMVSVISFFLYSFLREEIEVTDEMGDDIDLADLVPKVYEPIISWDVLQTKLINSMNKMNEEIRGSNMDLVFFKDAMIHLLRVRILRSCVFEIEFYDLSIDFTGY